MRHNIFAAAIAATLALACSGCILLPIANKDPEDADAQSITPAGDATEEKETPTTPSATSSSDARASRTPIADDGLRLPDMLGLPTERDLRRATSAESADDTSGGISARPPAEPEPEDD